MLSRVRLYAAKLEPGADEPVRSRSGFYHWLEAGYDWLREPEPVLAQ